jgi:hypothetical protein
LTQFDLNEGLKRMSSAHAQPEAHHHDGPRTLPATLGSPEILSKWRTQALIVFAVFALVSLVFFAAPLGPGHADAAVCQRR